MKILTVILTLASLSIGCSISATNGGRHNQRSHTQTFTAANEAELQDAVHRVNEFKQQLLEAGFREISSESSSYVGGGTRSKKILKGNYGNLHDVEITLWTSNKIDAQMNNEHIGVGAHCEITSQEEERQFDALVGKPELVATGHSLTPQT